MSSLPIIESCEDCGACCMQQGYPPYTDDEREYVPYELIAPIDEHIAALEEDDLATPCIWLDLETRCCRHYDYRPQVCRDFERGSEPCRLIRRQFRIGIH